jgi:NAD(P)H-hydrate epimerase
MARLLGVEMEAVQSNRIEVARAAAQQWNAIVTLKGPFTVIAGSDGHVTIIPFANAALATAGTGDVLAGTIVGLLAQYRAAARHDTGRSKESAAVASLSYRAAVTGAYVHATAGEIAARELGPAGLVASDLLLRLPVALRQVSRASQ